MKTFKAYFKKEVLESIRQYRYVILCVGIIFFSISGPITMKLLPEILKSQIHGDISSLFIITRKSVIQNYIKDLFQIGLMFVVFTAANSLSDEISAQKFVFPYAKGSSPTGIVLAKIIHYGMTTTLITLCGFCINFYYTNLLLKNDSVSFVNTIISGGYIAIYFTFNIILATFFSSILKKGIISGFIVLGINYFSIIINNMTNIRDFVPYRLIDYANSFSSFTGLKTVLAITVYSILLVMLTIYRMSKVEVI